MKRLLSLFLIIAMLMFTLTACAPSPEEERETLTSTTEPTQTETEVTENYFVTIDELSEVTEKLNVTGIVEYAERIDAIVQIIVNSGPFIQAST